MALVLGREELLAQLRALLFLPPPASSPAPAAPVKVESIMGTSGGGRRLGSKRDRDDDDDDDSEAEAEAEQHGEEPAAAQPHYCPPPPPLPPCKRTRRKKKKRQRQQSKCLVTTVPDFDGYQWRKYGQKQIEGAMYPRSYYRCIQSAKQGCQAKRTVQRNDDDATAAVPAEYTVVYVAEHTCTANDDALEAPPVILETTTSVVVPAAAAHTDPVVVVVPATTSAAAASACSTTVTTGTESPAISGDDVACWSSSGSSSGYSYADDCCCDGLLAAVVHGGCGSWSTVDSVSVPSFQLQEMEDLTGPIRSPVHVPRAWLDR